MFCSNFLNRCFLCCTFACDAGDLSLDTFQHFFHEWFFTLHFACCFGWLGCFDCWLGCFSCWLNCLGCWLSCWLGDLDYLFVRHRFALDRLGLWSGLFCFDRLWHFRCRLWSCQTLSLGCLGRWNLGLNFHLVDGLWFNFRVFNLLWVSLFLWRYRRGLWFSGRRKSLFDLNHVLWWVASKGYLSEHHRSWRPLSLLLRFHRHRNRLSNLFWFFSY